MDSRTVVLDTDGLTIAGESTPIVAGMLEYWRVNSLFWRRCLQAMKGAGLRQVSTFVCWDFHALDDGTLDFVGRTHPGRDLAGFIDLCGTEGFDVLLRLGPIIDGEWPTRGPIEEVCRLERIDPLYRERSEAYFRGVLEHIVPRLATHGGPVILVGLDNEPAFPMETRQKPAELQVPYHRDQVMEAYRQWVTERRPDSPPSIPTEPDYPNDVPEAIIESLEFQTDMVADHHKWALDACRALGVDVPVFTNMRQFSNHLDWTEIEQIVDSTGIGLFTPNMLPGEVPLVASWGVRLSRATMRFPWAVELQAIATAFREDFFGILDSGHSRYLTELALALGLRGLAYYVFVERDDVRYAPVSQLGMPRANIDEFAKAIRLANEMEADHQLADVGLLWCLDHHRLAVTSSLEGWRELWRISLEVSEPKESPSWWAAFRELHDADTDFEIAPMNGDMNGNTRASVLLYAGPGAVRPSDWRAVLDRVASGASLVFLTQPPTTALFGDDSTVLDINRRLVATGRVFHREKRPLAEVLDAARADWFVRSEVDSVWSTAYESDSRVLVFGANVGQRPQMTKLPISPALRERLSDTAVDLSDQSSLSIGEDVLVPSGLTLAPAEVRVLAIQTRP